MTAPFGAELPLPGPDQLVVYVLGPGVGESQVLVFPDGRCVVVDACMSRGVNLPAELLKHLGLARIDLLVLTHPDQDHFLGFAGLVKDFSPEEIWRYPFAGYVKDLVARWTQKRNAPARFKELYDALEAIEQYCDAHGTGTETNHSTTSWRNEASGYRVQSLAPTNYDQARLRRVWDKIIEFDVRGEPRLSRFARRLLKGQVGIPLVANVLSLALAVRWGPWKILLGGDVENGNRRPFSGWKGVLVHAARHGHGELVHEVDLVKVAHHGSSHAFHPPAWQNHRKPDGSTAAAVAPFNPSGLPTREVLTQLHPLCGSLGLTAYDARKMQTRVRASGWVRASGSASSGWAPCLAVVFPVKGRVQLSAHGPAQWFVHRKPGPGTRKGGPRRGTGQSTTKRSRSRGP